MKTATFITTRELSKRPGRVLKRLRKDGPQIVTQNGVPAGYLIPASALGIEADLGVIRSVLFGQAVDTVRREAALSGASKLTDDEIAREIASARATRRKARK